MIQLIVLFRREIGARASSVTHPTSSHPSSSTAFPNGSKSFSITGKRHVRIESTIDLEIYPLLEPVEIFVFVESASATSPASSKADQATGKQVAALRIAVFTFRGFLHCLLDFEIGCMTFAVEPWVGSAASGTEDHSNDLDQALMYLIWKIPGTTRMGEVWTGRDRGI